MTNKEKYQKVKGKIIESNPSILELSLGCELEFKYEDQNDTDIDKDKWYISQIIPRDFGWSKEDEIYIINGKGGYFSVGKDDSRIKKILGRPIQVNHVLMAIGDIKYLKLLGNQLRLDGGIYWQLDKDLDNQTDEVKEFLYTLLIK